MSLNSRKRAALILLQLLFLIGCGPASGARPAAAPLPASTRAGSLTVSVLRVSMARDWMPQVQKPGPDGGSPLGANVQLLLQNTGENDLQLTFAASIRDSQGRTYPASFVVLPGPYQWKGMLAARQEVTIEIGSADGPYLPVGSTASVVVTWTTQDGAVLSVQSPQCEIKRYG